MRWLLPIFTLPQLTAVLAALACVPAAVNAGIITTNLHMHLDASDIGGSNGDAVGNWVDQASTGGTVTFSATSTERPILRIDANSPNGEPYVDFDGSNDRLVGNGDVTDNFSDFTVFAVVKAADEAGSGTWGTIMSDYGADGAIWWLRSEDQTKHPRMAISDSTSDNPGGGRDSVNAQGTGTTDAAWLIITARLEGRTSEIFEDGILTGDRTNPDYDPGPWEAATAGQYAHLGALGAFHHLDGGIAEILVYGEALDDTDMNQTLQSLAEEYGIDVTPIPEPSTLTLTLLLLVLWVVRDWRTGPRR